jgi:murein DD-endopeptidase MepM/ murein hydrolase activator NlpD
MSRGRHAAPPAHSNLTRAAVTGGAILAATGTIAVIAPDAHAATTELNWTKVAGYKSSGNWAINTGNGFYGDLQFTQQTWAGFGGLAYAARADLATPAQQIAIAEKVLAVQGPNAWPVCSQGAATTAAAQPAPAPAPVVRSLVAKPAAPAASPALAPVVKPVSAGGSYTVVRGDTLGRIAAAHGTTVAALYTANRAIVGGNPNLIFPGQVLALPGGSAPAPSALAAPAPAASSSHAAAVEHPLPGGVITESYGDPGEVGVDLAAPLGTPLYAAAAGTVKYAGTASGYGDWIVITSQIDGQTVDFVYGHEFANGVLVHPGDTVTAGEQIGTVGNNGNSTGPHVEFCVWIGGLGGHTVNPVTWLAAHGVQVG